MAILVGVELAGILGALLAIPFAGIIQVIVRDLWDHRKGGLKDQPAIGEEEVPITTEPPPQSGSPGAGSHTSRRRLKAASSGRMAFPRAARASSSKSAYPATRNAVSSAAVACTVDRRRDDRPDKPRDIGGLAGPSHLTQWPESL
jgi:hypothetical protein